MKKIFYMLFSLFFFQQINFSQWGEQNNGQTYDLSALSVVNDNVIWIASSYRYVFRSTNGGINWNTVYNANDDSYYIYCIFSTDQDSAFLSVGSNGGSMIKKTANGGMNWTNVQNYSYDRTKSIYMSSLNGISIGDYPNATRWSIYKTNNGGISWDSSGLFLQKLSDEITFNNCMNVIGSNIWFASSKNKIYHSTDFGSTWQIQNPFWSLNSIANRFVWFNDLYNGITNVGSYINYTTNGGNNWYSTSQQLAEVNVAGLIGAGTKFWCSIDKKIYSTTNNGTNWVLEYTSPDAYFFNYFSKSRTGSCAWATRNHGGISKGSNLIGIKPISTLVPASYNLYQNYPNPFNPSTKIKFDIGPPLTPLLGKEGTGVVLKIYDILGHEVTTLVNEKLSPGTYEVEFNGANYSSGIYFYKLSAGSYTETKKLMLIK